METSIEVGLKKTKTSQKKWHSMFVESWDAAFSCCKQPLTKSWMQRWTVKSRGILNFSDKKKRFHRCINFDALEMFKSSSHPVVADVIARRDAVQRAAARRVYPTARSMSCAWTTTCVLLQCAFDECCLCRNCTRTF